MGRIDLEKALYTDIPSIDGRDIIIWGTGNTAQLYQEGFERLEKEGFEIKAYCDSRKHAGRGISRFFGKPVIAPEELEQYENACVLVCTPTPSTIREISRQLASMNMQRHLADEVILKLHADRVLACYDMLEDCWSKDIYEQLVMAHMTGEYPRKEFVSMGSQYFALDKFKNADTDEVFVDCGAWVGDTVEQYIWKHGGTFGKIIAFEPDADSFRAMEIRIRRLRKEWNYGRDKIKAYPYGVADAPKRGIFESYQADNGLGSKFTGSAADGQDSCGIVSLDSFLKEPYSFLKADIESYEYKMLLGAEQGIRRWKPKIAVCIYHNAADFYEIPLLIKSMVPEYKLEIRHHFYTLAETVLYCWTE